MSVTLNRKVANFKAKDQSDEMIQLKDFAGQKVVIYFYPKDSTPGCTTEGLDFNQALAKFKRQNTVILGVSKDSVKSHEKFASKQGFKFSLLADEDEKICHKFDVIQEKKLYGRTFMGIVRSTFVLDEDHKLCQEWRKVKVKGHVDEVLEFVKSMD